MATYQEQNSNAAPLGVGATLFQGLYVRGNGVKLFSTWEPFDAATYAQYRGISVADANLAILNALTQGALVQVS